MEADHHEAEQEGADPSATKPWVTMVLISVLGGVWAAMTLTGGAWDATESSELLTRWGAAVRPHLWVTGEFWRLVTANFLHIGAVHLAVNCYSLWWLGRAVEFLYGPWRLLYVYLVSGVLGSAASAVFGAPDVLSAGASGAIFGLLGAIIWYRVASPLGDRILWRPLVITLALNLGIGLALSGMVDNWNHVGGLVGGALAAAAIGVPLIPNFPAPRFYPGRRLQVVAAAIVLLATAALPLGLVDLPGAGRELARAQEALDQGDVIAAEPGLRLAVRRQPDQAALRAQLVVVLYALHQCEEALEHAEILVRDIPNRPEVLALREAVRDDCR